MSTIYLVRHGQASFAAEDYDQLSRTGEEQAQHLGSVLKARLPQIDVVVSGDMRRHRQTATGCLAAMGVTAAVREDNGWNEYDHRQVIARFEPRYKDPSVMAKDFLNAPKPATAFQAMFAQAMTRWMGGGFDQDYTESWPTFTGRVKAALKRLVAEVAPGQTALVFTSGGPIATVAGHLLEMPPPAVMRLSWTLVNASLTKIITNGDTVTLATLNDHGHFEDPQRALLTYR